MTRHVIDEVLLLSGCSAKDVPKSGGLHKVLIGNLAEEVMNGLAGPMLMLTSGLNISVRQVLTSSRIRSPGSVVAVDSHSAITLEGVEGDVRGVDGDLLIVGTQTMSVGIRVREKTRLENGIGGRLDTGDEVRGRESSLLNLGEVVLNVLVQGKLANRSKGHLALRPDLG